MTSQFPSPKLIWGSIGRGSTGRGYLKIPPSFWAKTEVPEERTQTKQNKMMLNTFNVIPFFISLSPFEYFLCPT
jgi:hypothetical protein